MKKHYFLFLLILLLNVTITSAQYAWQVRTNFGGTARLGAFGFSIGNFGYIGGGTDGNNLSDFWQFDPSANSWSQKSDVPVAVYAASTFVVNGQGYLTCGVPANSYPYNTTLYMYDPVANTWTSKAAFPGVSRYGAAAFAVGTKGYVGVGNEGSATGPYCNDFFEYDAIADSWTQKTSFPGAVRYGSFGIALNGAGYIGFGFDYALGTFYNDWYEYDPVADSWSEKTSFPGTPRHYIGGFTINNLIYAGTGNASNSEAVRDFYEYNPGTDSWARKQDYGAGSRWIVASFSIGDIGYFGTGSDSISNYYNEFWEYAPTSVPGASFQSSDSTICTYNCINFTDLSTNATSWQWSFPGATITSSTDQNPQNICYFNAGQYDVTLIASNSNGSDTLTLSNYITVNASPPTPVIIQKGDTLYFVKDPSDVSYQWYYFGTPITAATDTFLVVSFDGNYNVDVTNEYGCSIAVGITVVLGIDEVESSPYFNLYPNPVSKTLTISILKNFNKADIEINDMLGRRIFERAFDSANDNKFEIDLRNFAPDIYFITINIDGSRATGKFIKEAISE